MILLVSECLIDDPCRRQIPTVHRLDARPVHPAASIVNDVFTLFQNLDPFAVAESHDLSLWESEIVGGFAVLEADCPPYRPSPKRTIRVWSHAQGFADHGCCHPELGIAQDVLSRWRRQCSVHMIRIKEEQTGAAHNGECNQFENVATEDLHLFDCINSCVSNAASPSEDVCPVT